MAKTIYNCDALTGGAARALDSHSVGDLADGDRAIVLDASYNRMVFEYQSAATDAEDVSNHPYRVRPDDYATAGVWYEQLDIDRPLNSARFIWKDADEIYLNAAAYMHRGTKDQVVYWDSQLTFQFGSAGSNAGSDDLANNDWFYVYLDDSAIVTAASPVITAAQLVGSITEPTWSDSKHGWYNGADRCIFAVRTDGAAQVLEFFHDGGDYIAYADTITDMVATDIDTTWTDVTLTMPVVSTRALINVVSVYVDGNALAYWRTNGQTGSSGHNCGYVGVTVAFAYAHPTVLTDSTQKIEIKNHLGNGNTITLYTDGFFLPIEG